MKKGRLIVFDGGEGAGKGTVLNEVKEVFKNDEVVFTREPGGTEFAEEIREKCILSSAAKDQDPVNTFLWFWLARIDHGRNLILPAIEQGKHVISDRYDSSTWAYQICAQDHQDLADDFWAMKGDFSVQPFLYIYLDVDPSEGLRRAKDRGERNHFDGRDIHFHSKVRAGFLQFLGKMKDRGVRTRIIDANRSIDEVVRDSVGVVCTALVA